MLHVCGVRDCEPGRLQSTDTELRTIDRHDLGESALRVGQETGQRKHPLRYVGLEHRLSDKYHDGKYDVGVEEIEEFSYGTDMLEVLA
jgi:hypothetical protein